jgi:hypothetical protein
MNFKALKKEVDIEHEGTGAEASGNGGAPCSR